MSFLTNIIFWDLLFLVVASISVFLFLWKRKGRVDREGIMFLYRTKVGLKIIDTIGKKYKKTLKVMSYLIVVTGYILMVVMLFLLFELVKFFSNPALVQLIKVPPLIPLIPYLPSLFKITWLPPFYFTYWIIAIAVIAIAHEGFHGIYARFHNIKIKSTGFGFLGPFLAFFVEQDDKQMTEKKIFPQLTILAAGVFANIIVGIIFLIMIFGFFSLTYAPAGALFNNYAVSGVAASSIMMVTENITLESGVNTTQVFANNRSYIAGKKYLKSQLDEGVEEIILIEDKPAIRLGLSGAITLINDEQVYSYQDFNEKLAQYSPGDTITLREEDNGVITDYEIVVAEDYENPGEPDIGVRFTELRGGARGSIYKIMNAFRDPEVFYKPKANPNLTLFIYNLLWWIILINLSVALVNMLPMGIFDGGRFFYLTILALTKNEKIAKRAFKFITGIILLILVVLMILWAINIR